MSESRPIAHLSPDELAELKRCCEETDASLDRIAARFQVSASSLRHTAKRQGWVRRCKTVRAPPTASVAAAAVRIAVAAKPPRPRSAAERLEHLLTGEIAAVETLRRDAGATDVADAERVARTLERLADTLAKVRRLREPDPVADPDDDLPRDIDEFRRVLARRLAQLAGDGPDRGDPRRLEPGDPDEAR